MPFKRGKEMALRSFATDAPGSKAKKITFYYSLALRQIPKSAGKLTFKNEIGTEESARVPVSVVVRP